MEPSQTEYAFFRWYSGHALDRTHVSAHLANPVGYRFSMVLFHVQGSGKARCYGNTAKLYNLKGILCYPEPL